MHADGLNLRTLAEPQQERTLPIRCDAWHVASIVDQQRQPVSSIAPSLRALAFLSRLALARSHQANGRAGRPAGRIACRLVGSAQASALCGPAGGQRQAPIGPAAFQPVGDRPRRARGQRDAARDVDGNGRSVQRVAPRGQRVDLPQRKGLPAAELGACRKGCASARETGDQDRTAAD